MMLLGINNFFLHFLFLFFRNIFNDEKNSLKLISPNVYNGLHQISTLQSDDGLQLAPTVLIFGNFRCFKGAILRTKKNSDKKLGKLCFVLEDQMCKMKCTKCELQADGGLHLAPNVLIFGHFRHFKVRFCESRIFD